MNREQFDALIYGVAIFYGVYRTSQIVTHLGSIARSLATLAGCAAAVRAERERNRADR